MSQTRVDHRFETGQPPEAVWELLRVLRVERAGGDVTDGGWWLPGFASWCTELSFDDHELRVRKDEEPCAGTTIAVTIEHAPSGSRICVVQSGFDPAFVAAAGELFRLHAEHIFADLELFFRTGALGGRAWRWPAVDLGFTAMAATTSVVVHDVRGASWADTVGLVPGDLLLALAGAAVYGHRELEVARQTIRRGSDVSVTFVRDGSVHHASATV